ncbi:Hypothetical protein BSPT2_I1878 [Brucella suis bv. 2]|nr:Hypothetical protein BSSP3_I1881 [Brucella suis bv. 2]AIB25321.1 Hypothetical protein BSPT2_I1878 [Brucella suis bv. 2]
MGALAGKEECQSNPGKGAERFCIGNGTQTKARDAAVRSAGHCAETSLNIVNKPKNLPGK